MNCVRRSRGNGADTVCGDKGGCNTEIIAVVGRVEVGECSRSGGIADSGPGSPLGTSSGIGGVHRLRVGKNHRGGVAEPGVGHRDAVEERGRRRRAHTRSGPGGAVGGDFLQDGQFTAMGVGGNVAGAVLSTHGRGYRSYPGSGYRRVGNGALSDRYDHGLGLKDLPAIGRGEGADGAARVVDQLDAAEGGRCAGANGGVGDCADREGAVVGGAGVDVDDVVELQGVDD